MSCATYAELSSPERRSAPAAASTSTGTDSVPASVPASVPVVYSCSVNGKTVNSIAFLPSEAADGTEESKMSFVHAAARQEASAGHLAPVQCSHVRYVPTEPQNKAPDHWLSKKMAPNCAASGYDANAVTSWNHWTCRYAGSAVVVDEEGKQQSVRNPFKEWRGTLPSCDSYSDGLQISDSVMKAVQMQAYEAAGGKESKMDVTQFVCDVQSLPIK